VHCDQPLGSGLEQLCHLAFCAWVLTWKPEQYSDRSFYASSSLEMLYNFPFFADRPSACGQSGHVPSGNH
jgi:hypothetical protein